VVLLRKTLRGLLKDHAVAALVSAPTRQPRAAGVTSGLRSYTTLLDFTERRSAIEHLSRARERAVALRARPLLTRCNRELSACGINESPLPFQVGSDLTPQERAVTRLVCAGKTNKEVARELVLSTKTIGYHLGNVYAKLDVHSRSQLIAKMPFQFNSSQDRWGQQRSAT
jgi:DNA-binding CsgD family transcriptional regulator